MKETTESQKQVAKLNRAKYQSAWDKYEQAITEHQHSKAEYRQAELKWHQAKQAKRKADMKHTEAYIEFDRIRKAKDANEI